MDFKTLVSMFLLEIMVHTVHGYPADEKPRITGVSQNMMGNSGDYVFTLSVHVAPKDQLPKVEFTHNGDKINPDSRHKITNRGDQFTLIVAPATDKDSGTYNCIATNSAGQASTSVNVNLGNDDGGDVEAGIAGINHYIQDMMMNIFG